MKGIFVGSLNEIESRLGNDFPGYEELRSAILRIGNDALRDMHLSMSAVNVEYIPDKIVATQRRTRQGEENGSKETS
jgi:hypothetical protein